MTRNSTGDVAIRPPHRQRAVADDGPHWPDPQNANRPSKRGSE